MTDLTHKASGPVSRRAVVLGGGALVVWFSLRSPALAQDARDAQNRGTVPEPAPELPGNLKASPLLDSWVRISADGTITVMTGKAELGQGIKTALLQVAAEELAVGIHDITLITADTHLTPNEGYTAGSHSMQDSGTAIRIAAAQTRGILIALAAQRLGKAPGELHAEKAAVVAGDGQRLAYRDLVAGADFHVRVDLKSPLVPPDQHTIVGNPVQRVDIPGKITGAPSYVQDFRPDGLLHARVVRPPGYGAKLLEVPSVDTMPGVVKVVRDGSYLAVVADTEWQAIKAMRALASGAKWSEPQRLPAGSRFGDIEQAKFRAIPIKDDPPSAVRGKTTLEATYRRPYLMHGSIGPSCAVGLMKDGELTIWSHTQGVYPLRDAIAEMVRMPKDKVRVIHVEGAGCYGQNAADDAGADAALIARAVPERPVRVQWMREDEHTWEPFGPSMLMKLKATLDGSGKVIDYEHQVWSPTHSTRPAPAGNLAPAWALAEPFAPPEPKPLPQPEGGGDRNAIPLYTFPRMRVVNNFVTDMPLRVSALRTLGAYANVFALESFVDELAAAAQADPVEFRLAHLDDGRAREVVTTAAEKFGWKGWSRKSPHHGRGFAFARYKNLAAYVGLACEVTVEPETGHVQVGRIVAAVDSGQAVNPDGIRNQIEGAVVQSLSWTLQECVSFDPHRITSTDWGSYPIHRFTQVPESVEVHVVDRKDQPFLGTGEAGQGPAGAAVANAVAHATGKRCRDLPLSPALLVRQLRA